MGGRPFAPLSRELWRRRDTLFIKMAEKSGKVLIEVLSQKPNEGVRFTITQNSSFV